MADELELLRRANPVPVDGPHHGDGPLDHNAERHLDRLLHERFGIDHTTIQIEEDECVDEECR